MFVQLTQDFLGRKAGERIDVDKTHADALIDKGVATSVTDDVITPAVSRAIEGAFGKFNEALNGVIGQSLKQLAGAQTLARKHAIPAIFGAAGAGDRDHNFGDWLLAVRRGDAGYLADKYDSHLVEGGEPGGVSPGRKAAMSTASGTTGGYTVPTEFLPRLLEATTDQSVVRPRATIVPMSTRSLQIPYLDITNAPTAGDTAFLGGLVGRWTEEAGTLNETEPTFRQFELVAHELSGYSLMSNTLLQDNAVGLEAVLIKLFGGAIAWFEDQAFLRGNGVGKPLGAEVCPAAIGVARDTSAAFKLVDAATMIGRLLPGWSPKSTCWVVHPNVIPQLCTMVSSAAGVGWLQRLGDQQLPMELLGLPVAVSEKLPAMSSTSVGDVALIDFQHYIIGDRQQVEIAYSEHFKFTNNQATWRFVARVDGQPWLRKAVTLADAASTVSPYVYLDVHS